MPNGMLNDLTEKQIYDRNWYEINKEKVKDRAKRYREEYPERVAITKKRINLRYKTDALTHYSLGNNPICARCGITDINVLTLDHINGGGTRKRREGIEGVNLALWLKQNNYPDGYQVLCANCNLKKRITEHC